MYNGNCGLYFTLSCDDGERKNFKQEGRTENIYFFYGIIRLKNCFSIELLSPIYGAKRRKKSQEIFPKISSFLFVFLHALSFYFFPANIYLATSHITLDFFPLQNIPCEAIIFDLLRSPKLYFCSFLLLMPCHTVRNNKLAFTSCSLTLSIAAKNFLQRENCEEGEGELCGSMASQ